MIRMIFVQFWQPRSDLPAQKMSQAGFQLDVGQGDINILLAHAYIIAHKREAVVVST